MKNSKTLFLGIFLVAMIVSFVYLMNANDANYFFNILDQKVFIRAHLASICLLLILGIAVAEIYKKSSHFSSEKNKIYQSILPIMLITYLIMNTISLSLSLSLGLVGSLSIIRFRTPIKDITDIVYLFISFCTGIIVSSNRMLVAILIGYPILFVLLIIYSKLEIGNNSYSLKIEASSEELTLFNELLDVLKNKVSIVNEAYVQDDSIIESIYRVKINNENDHIWLMSCLQSSEFKFNLVKI